MLDKVIATRSNFGLISCLILSMIILIPSIIGYWIVRGHELFYAFSIFFLAFAILALCLAIYGLYMIIIAPPKNLIELKDSQLIVRPRRNVEHTLALCDIINVLEKSHLMRMGSADSFYYGKVLIVTNRDKIMIPFVRKHRKVCQLLRVLINNKG